MFRESFFGTATVILALLALTCSRCALAVRVNTMTTFTETAVGQVADPRSAVVKTDLASLAARRHLATVPDLPNDFPLPTLPSDIPITSVVIDSAGYKAAESSAKGANSTRKGIHHIFPGTDDDDSDRPQNTKQGSIPTFTGPILYHGGPVMTGQVNVYVLYLNFAKNAVAPDWINYMVSNLQGSPWWRTVTEYYSDVGGNKTYVSGHIKLGAAASVQVPNKMYLDLSDVPAVGQFAQYAIQQKWVPNDKTNGIYVVVPAISNNIYLQSGPDGYCGSQGWCGWHSAYEGIKIALIPEPACEGCELPQLEVTDNGKYSPSGDPGVDAMCSTVAHELSESVTDPNAATGWLDADDNEVADMCVYSYGNFSYMKAPTGNRTIYFNTQIGNIPFILQQLWDPVFRPNSTTKQLGCTSGIYDYVSLRSNASSNKCLDIPDDNQNEGQVLSTGVCNATFSTKQQFDLAPSESNYYNFRTSEGLCVGVKGKSTGSEVTLQLCNVTNTAQQFGFFGNKTYEIKPRNAIAHNLCLDVNGTKVEISTCNGSPAQLFIPSSSVNIVNV